MWIKALDGTLHNASDFSKIRILKHEHTPSGYEDTAKEPFPDEWIIKADQTVLAQYTDEKTANKAFARLTAGIEAVDLKSG